LAKTAVGGDKKDFIEGLGVLKMKKKVLMSLVLLTMVTASAVFAQGISLAAGGGLLLDWSVNNGIKVEYHGESLSISLDNLSFGGFGFFDATYAEADVSFAYGSLTGTEKGRIGSHSASGTEEKESALQLGFSLLGKYPIKLGGFTIFPLLGFNYNIVLSAWDKNGKPDDDDLSQFGFLAGAGLDFPFTDALFLRAEALFQLRLAGKSQHDAAEDLKKATPYDVNTTLGLGPRIKVGVGYKF